jgi:hypothetical protein
MALEICPLCLLPKELVISHFIPAAAYKPLYAENLSVNEPMVMTPRKIFQSSRQITGRNLCSDCEHILNEGGEMWTLDKLATLSTFVLRDIVCTAPLIVNEDDFKVFNCEALPELKIDKLVHFSAGLFWKSAACTWPMLNGPVNQIDLGPYKEPLRQFVLGLAPFPRDMCLIIYLDAKKTPLIAMTPPRKFKSVNFHMFAFYLHGLQCLLCVGKMAPREVGDFCVATANGRPIFVIPDVGDKFFDVMKPFTRNSVPSTRIRQTLEEWKRRQTK